MRLSGRHFTVISIIALLLFALNLNITAEELLDVVEKAENLYRSESYYFAYKEYDKAFKLADDEADRSLLLLRMGMCQYKLENYGLAADSFDRIISNYSSNAYTDNALFFSALTYNKLGNYPTTASRLLRLIRYEKRTRYYDRAKDGLENLFADGLTTDQISWVMETVVPTRVTGEHLYELAEELKDDHSDKSLVILFELSRDYRKYDFIDDVEELIEELRKKIKPISNHIGVIAPLKGQYEEYGEDVVRGVELAVENFNELHPDNKFKVFVANSEEDPDRTAETLIKLSNTNRVAGVVGPLFTDVLLSLSEEAERLNIPVISPSAGSGEIQGSHSCIYRCTLTNEIQAKIIADYAINVLNLNKFSILYPDTGYGEEMRDYFHHYVEEMGGKIAGEVAYELIPEEEKYADYTGVVKKIKYTRPQAIFIPGHYEELMLLVPQIAYSHIPAVILGASGWDEDRVARMGGKYFEGTYFISPFNPEGSNPELRRFVVDYYKEYGDEPNFISAQAYDTANILMMSILKGVEENLDVNDVLEKMKNYKGITGRITLRGEEDDCEKSALIMTIREGEKIPVTDE